MRDWCGQAKREALGPHPPARRANGSPHEAGVRRLGAEGSYSSWDWPPGQTCVGGSEKEEEHSGSSASAAAPLASTAHDLWCVQSDLSNRWQCSIFLFRRAIGQLFQYRPSLIRIEWGRSDSSRCLVARGVRDRGGFGEQPPDVAGEPLLAREETRRPATHQLEHHCHSAFCSVRLGGSPICRLAGRESAVAGLLPIPSKWGESARSAVRARSSLFGTDAGQAGPCAWEPT